MARYIFGGSTSDFTYAVYTSGGRKYPVLEPATLTFWDSETGGVQQTVTLNGTDVTSVTVGTDGLIPDFLGPDGVTALWADAGAGRVRMTTSDPLGALSPVATTGAYSDLSGKPTIPATAADVGAYSKSEATVTFVSAVIVDGYRQAGDTDDTAAWNRAIAAAISNGKKYILAPSPTYTCSAAIDLTGLNGVVIAGTGMHSTVITFNGGASAINGGFYNTGSLSRVTFRDMTIKGTVVDDVTVSQPRRSRTNSGGAGVNTAILLKANRPGQTGFGTISDVRLTRVRFEAINQLPFVFDGVTGYAAAYDVECYNTKDGSWLFCEHVVFDSLRSYKSHDNGFSISRSNAKVTGGSVEVHGCFDYGVFASGFVVDNNANDAGPQNVIIDSINVQYAGQGGVKLDDGPQGVVIGNVYVNTVYRGGIDVPTDSGGIGILIGGNPATPTRAATPTVYASAIQVQNALLVNCNRGGVLISGGAKDVTLDNFTILDAGSQYLADGTTAVTTGDRNNNFGIAVAASFASSVTNVWARNVRVVDRRGTPYTNYPIDFSTATGCGYAGLSASGCRVTVDNGNVDETFGGLKTFKQRIVTKAPAASIFPGGSTASAATAASNGANDMAGTVNITTIASPPAGILATVTFGGTYSATPHVVLSPTNSASAACQPYVANRNTTQFQIACAVAPAGSASLSFDYHIMT